MDAPAGSNNALATRRWRPPRTPLRWTPPAANSSKRSIVPTLPRRAGAGVAPADAEWRRAKARLIELETGAPPTWVDHAAETATASASDHDA